MVDFVSIIIRAKNEEEHIGQCLVGVSNQLYINSEIIIVDNESSDRTLEIVQNFDCKIIKISDNEWSFGRALNRGIENSNGNLCAILSGHCIPVNNNWLINLKSHFEETETVGVYGRQIPLFSTNNQDKRDLWNHFGIEQRVQTQDTFFHNANSMIRRAVWERTPFDEEANGLEDRIWAKEVLNGGNKIIYTPHAEVTHHHGLHHSGDEKRAKRIVETIEKYNLHKP